MNRRLGAATILFHSSLSGRIDFIWLPHFGDGSTTNQSLTMPRVLPDRHRLGIPWHRANGFVSNHYVSVDWTATSLCWFNTSWVCWPTNSISAYLLVRCFPVSSRCCAAATSSTCAPLCRSLAMYNAINELLLGNRMAETYVAVSVGIEHPTRKVSSDLGTWGRFGINTWMYYNVIIPFPPNFYRSKLGFRLDIQNP